MLNGTDPWELYYKRGAVTWKGSPYSLPELKIGSRVLDIGCGTGSTLIRAIDRGWDVVGVDISASALDITGKRLDQRGLECDLRVLDITDDVSDLGKFDLIFCHYILGALGKVARDLASSNIVSMMKKGSILSFEDIAVGDIREGRGRMIEEMTFIKGNGIVQHFFTLDEIKELFKDLDTSDVLIDEWTHGMMKRKRTRGLMILE